MSIQRHTGPLPVFRSEPGVRADRNGSLAHNRGQSITVSVPALRTFAALTAVVVISVILSVIATVAIISVLNAGAVLPNYARLNQPNQVSQLGVCVSKNGTISQPTNLGFCPSGKFVHVVPKITHP